MRKAKVSWIERLEHSLVKIIQQPGADLDQPGPVRALLAFLTGVSCVFRAVVAVRYWFYDLGLLRRFPLGCQVISIGNVTAGGTGKTPVTERFARELAAQGRKVAILSRGYRRKEAPWWKRMFSQVIEPPLVVSDGKRVLLDSATGGDEPYMLASNLPGVCVLVDRNRVKSGRYAIRRFGCDTLLLDDGFQYQKLKHSLEVVLVDKTNPFGNGHMLPRGVLREPAKHVSRADVIFLTKSDGQTEDVIRRVRAYNDKAEIIECRHAPRMLKDVWSREELPLDWLKGKTLATLSGIAVPQGFEDSLRKLGAKVIWCERYADHHRYDASEIIYALNRAADLGAEALITTEKDAVRFPRLETTPVPSYYLRVDIEILKGEENFAAAVDRICNVQAPSRSARRI
ncbi:MAG: tetraacyldisaccharide 4'-kinase [Kiritimatiellae bacterium]|nr:tetraacyldisaccharide 4'-kinase [Kiritimatiellia bacterium]